MHGSTSNRVQTVKVNTVTKSETREIENVKRYITAGMPDTAARALSALVRAARNRKSSAELMQHAVDLNLLHRAEFII